MSAELAEVSFERVDGVAVVAVAGEIDMSNAPSIRLKIAEHITPADEAVVLDISEVSFIDSAGLHVIFELGELLEERRQQLHLCVPPGGQVARAVEIVGMRGAVWIHAGRVEAVDAARASTAEAKPFTPSDES